MTRTVADRILARASRPGGASRHELTSHAFEEKWRNEARTVLDALVKAGVVLRFTRPAKGAGSGQPAQRFFCDRHEGEAWAGLVVKPPRKPRSDYVAVPLTISTKRSRAVVLEPAAPVIVPAGVLRTYGPSHPFDARYQCDPAARVAGGFQSMGVGRYLEAT